MIVKAFYGLARKRDGRYDLVYSSNEKLKLKIGEISARNASKFGYIVIDNPSFSNQHAQDALITLQFFLDITLFSSMTNEELIKEYKLKINQI